MDKKLRKERNSFLSWCNFLLPICSAQIIATSRVFSPQKVAKEGKSPNFREIQVGEISVFRASTLLEMVWIQITVEWLHCKASTPLSVESPSDISWLYFIIGVNVSGAQWAGAGWYNLSGRIWLWFLESWGSSKMVESFLPTVVVRRASTRFVMDPILNLFGWRYFYVPVVCFTFASDHRPAIASRDRVIDMTRQRGWWKYYSLTRIRCRFWWKTVVDFVANKLMDPPKVWESSSKAAEFRVC